MKNFQEMENFQEMKNFQPVAEANKTYLQIEAIQKVSTIERREVVPKKGEGGLSKGVSALAHVISTR